MLKVMPTPVGAVTSMVPVATVQVGCAVTLTVGVAGAEAGALTVTLVEADIQPLAFCAVTL